ncbi:MAG: ornithine cyclodeaminase [Frankiales bacterium]|nr:ornithine cyclodeaminase [Frankiales bacterium]
MTAAPGHVLLLGAKDVRELLPWPELIAATSDALRTIATSDGGLPASSSQVLVPGAALHLKAGALLDPPVLSVKANLRPDRGSSSGAILVFDHRAQRLEAVLASADLTAMRTGAIAAVAARSLLRAPNPTVALVGSGPIARYTYLALREVLDQFAVRVWSRHPDRARHFVEQEVPSDGQALATVAEAVRGADLVVTCTPSREPLLESADLHDGAVVLAMGADSPGKRELGPGVLDRAQLYVDVLTDALVFGEHQHLAQHRDDVLELGAVLGDGVPSSEYALTVFDSVGSASVDAAATALVVERARSLGWGATINLGSD